MEREGFTIAVADRRRDDVARAHGGEDRARVSAGPVVCVTDASRAVGVARNCVATNARDVRRRSARRDTRRIARARARQDGAAALAAIAEARHTAMRPTGRSNVPTRAAFSGAGVFCRTTAGRNRAVHRLVAVLQDVGTGRPKSENPQTIQSWARPRASGSPTRRRCCDRIIEGSGCQREWRVRLFSARSDRRRHRDVRRRESRTSRSETLHHNLRQQTKKPPARSNSLLADFIAPGRASATASVAFAVNAGTGATKKWRKFEAQTTTTTRSCSRRSPTGLAEAFAELHERVRKEFWGYAREEANRCHRELIAENYRGIRPAPGLSRVPGPHREGHAVHAARVRSARACRSPSISRCCRPPRSPGATSRIPTARYFGVGKIGRDQVEDYARRKGVPVAEAERWLAGALGVRA